MKVFLLAGEVSGDVAAGHLARTLRTLDPAVELVGLGGSRMREAGVRILQETAEWGIVGYLEAYLRVPLFALRLFTVLGLIRAERPDVLVLVDFPGFNVAVARRASRWVPTCYYFPPMAYGRRGNRARVLADVPVRVLVPFEFEAEAYRKAGADVVFVGHPAVDWTKPQLPKEVLFRELGLNPHLPLVTLLPGSRVQEVRALLPIMVEGVRRARFTVPGLQAAVAQAAEHLGPVIRPLAGGLPVVQGRTYDLLAASDAAVVASGTATLEGTILAVPMVVTYRVSKVTAWIARRIATCPWVSLPNLLAGSEVVPELLQERATPQLLATELLAILEPDRAGRVRSALEALRPRLGLPGALERAAREILAYPHRIG